MMKLPTFTLFPLVLFIHLSVAWDTDPRCTSRNAPVTKTVFTNEEPDTTSVEDGLQPQDIVPIDDVDFSPVQSDSKIVRAIPSDRQLQEQAFQLKLHWEVGHCWQEEWRERKWCMECQGGSCNENDYLWLEKCDDSEEQLFVYDSVPGGGKLRPYTNQDLCWERTSTNAHRLKPCQDKTTQIIVGFQPSGKFEIHPHGQPDKCLSQQHHPKAKEVIRSENCRTARGDKTSYWHVNGTGPSVSPTSPSPTSPPTPALPPNALNDRGINHCKTNECGPCEGDCDNDSQCRGNLKCFQRNAFQDVPGCEGGKDLSTLTDFCYYDEDDNDDEDDEDDEDNDDDDNVFLTEIKNYGENYCIGRKCGQCEGSCNDDDQCAGALRCFIRNGNEVVAGCSGSDDPANFGLDVCYDPGFITAPSIAPTTATPTMIAPTMIALAPADFPSSAPSTIPSSAPSTIPSSAPSLAPSILLTDIPSTAPSEAPSLSPSETPTVIVTAPTRFYTIISTTAPTTSAPTSVAPTMTKKTVSPTMAPLTMVSPPTPRGVPTEKPTIAPTILRQKKTSSPTRPEEDDNVATSASYSRSRWVVLLLPLMLLSIILA